MEPLWRISAATYKLARTIIFSVIGVVAVSLILAMFLSNNLSKPIKEITRIIDNTSDKNQQILVLDSMQSVSKKDIEDGETYLSSMSSNLDILRQALGEK